MWRMIIFAIVTNTLFAFFWRRSTLGGVQPQMFLVVAGLIYAVYGFSYQYIVNPKAPVTAITNTTICYLAICVLAGALLYHVASQLWVQQDLSYLYPMLAAGSMILITILGSIFDTAVKQASQEPQPHKLLFRFIGIGCALIAIAFLNFYDIKKCIQSLNK